VDFEDENKSLVFLNFVLQVLFKPLQEKKLGFFLRIIKVNVMDCRELGSLLGGEINSIPWRC
jgi:hypothetical protein